MKNILIATATTAALTSSAAFAAETETVEFSVSGTVEQQCHLTDPTDVNFGVIELEGNNVPGVDSLTLNNGSQDGNTENLWVSCNYGAQISASSANGGLFNAAGQGLVDNDPNDFTNLVNYRVNLTSTDESFPDFKLWTKGSGSTGPVTAGGAFHDNANFRVFIDADGTPKRPVAGAYTDTVTLTVGPV